jgi:CHAT domain-containing protein
MKRRSEVTLSRSIGGEQANGAAESRMTRTTHLAFWPAITSGLLSVITAVPHADTRPFPVAPLTAHRMPDVAALDAGPAIERYLTRGNDHQYRLTLKAGEWLRVIVEQRGVDVAVQTRDGAGNVIATVDDEIRLDGDEDVDLVANVSGTYTFSVTASPVALGAGRYTIRIASRRPATDADREAQDSRRLRTAAVRLEADGRYEEGRGLLERALSLSEQAGGPESTDTAMVLFRLAENALETRDDSRARMVLMRAIAIYENAWGAEHPYTAMARARLAAVDQRAGDGPKADAALRQSIGILDKALGTDHLWYVRCLTTQSNVRVDAHDVEKAEALRREVVAILERTQNTETIQYAVALHNLAEVYLMKRDYVRAEDLFNRSLVVTNQIEGPESYRVSTKLQSLAIIARDEKDYARALDYDTRALAIRERILGDHHADIAPLLNNIAVLYHLTGDDADALPLFFRALAIRERTVGPYHTGTLNALTNIANSYAGIGDIAQAIAFERRAAAIVDKQLELNLAVGSERQKLAFVRGNTGRTDQTISLHLVQAPNNSDAASLATLVMLQRKGRVQDAMSDMFAAFRQRDTDPHDWALFDQLNETTTELAHMALATDDRLRSAEQHQSAAELDARREQLETILSEHSAEFRVEAEAVTVEAVQAAIPEDAALLEFAVFRPFDPRADVYGPARYAAYVVHRQGTPIGIDLGETVPMDRLIDALRMVLRNPNDPGTKAAAHAVYLAVMAPLRTSLGDAVHLIVSPDGALNLVPFEALVDDVGAYLIERYDTNYVSSGRDLLRMQLPHQASNPPVILADPSFGRPVDTTPEGRTYFAPLAATGLEAQAIKQLFPDATLLVGGDATKARLQQVKAPSILHIASHGFFRDDSSHANAPTAPGNPLLRSGLALAGANRTEHGSNDGILTALEATGLDLWGTKLVTLSACDTGVGEVRNGEGVYGLRRAFVLAGAETVVMNLWPVSDYVARDVMVMYYAGLRIGLGRGDALRNAKLAMMKRRHREHPYFWAGLIASGEWANLDGER